MIRRAATKLANIRQELTDEQLEQGAVWYPNAQSFCREVAREYERDWHIVAAALATLSQRNRWNKNKEYTIRLLSDPSAAPAGLPKAWYKARHIILARDTSILSGTKITAFYRAICGDSEAVVLDTHMLSAMGFTGKWPTDPQYRMLCGVVSRAAKKTHLSPRDLQAAIWVHWRGAAE